MNYEKVLGEHKFPTYEELKTGLIRLIDEGKISREDAARLLPELRESEDEMIRKAVVSLVYEMKGTYQSFAKVELDKMVAWLEKQKETPMPNSTELIEMWHKAKAILKEKDFRGDEWRLAQNAFMDGFARGTCVKFEKQKDQKPAEKQDYSGLNDLERAIHRGFISAGVENVSITIIKETARECLAQMNPEEWNDTDMKEARDSLISVCRDWERGQKTTLLPIAAVRARYFLEHLTEPKPAGWSEEDETHLGWIIECFDSWKYQVPEFADQYQSAINWLKSLRPQPKQEWSKEDENKIERLAFLVSVVAEKEMISPEECIDLRRFVKSYRPSWKPSEEQMKALEIAFRKDGDDNYRNAINSLYNDLKKL